MADKLSETTWSAFTKKHKLALDDAALIKALAKFDKSDESKLEPRLEALKGVIELITKQVPLLVKKKQEIGDKIFGETKDKLYELLDVAERLQKETLAQMEAAEDEEDAPVLLTSKMVPLLRELRKGESRMHAMICTAGKATAVLVMRRPISVSRRKLLAVAVDAAGGAKYIVGECLMEDKALTFVVKGQAGGLAKRLRAALLEQTGLRLRVRVRGEDGGADLDGEDEDDEQPAQTATQTADAVQHEASVETAPTAEQLAFEQRRRGLQARLDQALRDPHPESTKLRALSAFASEKADEQKDYAVAAKALEKIEQLLEASAAGGPSANAKADGAQQGKPDRGFVALQQSRLVWEAAQRKARAELSQLRKAVINAYKGTPRQAEAVAAQAELADLLTDFDNRLLDALDAALNASDTARRAELQAQARTVLDGYRAALDSDVLLRDLDANPFVEVKIFGTLDQTLKVLGRQLAA